MIGLLQNIFDIITSIFDFVFGFIGDLVEIAKMLGEVVLSVPNLLNSFLPTSVGTLLLTGVSVAVIYKIAGRE